MSSYLRTAWFLNTTSVALTLVCVFEDPGWQKTFSLPAGDILEVSNQPQTNQQPSEIKLLRVIISDPSGNSQEFDNPLGQENGKTKFFYTVEQLSDKKLNVAPVSDQKWEELTSKKLTSDDRGRSDESQGSTRHLLNQQYNSEKVSIEGQKGAQVHEKLISKPLNGEQKSINKVQNYDQEFICSDVKQKLAVLDYNQELNKQNEQSKMREDQIFIKGVGILNLTEREQTVSCHYKESEQETETLLPKAFFGFFSKIEKYGWKCLDSIVKVTIQDKSNYNSPHLITFESGERSKKKFFILTQNNQKILEAKETSQQEFIQELEKQHDINNIIENKENESYLKFSHLLKYTLDENQSKASQPAGDQEYSNSQDISANREKEEGTNRHLFDKKFNQGQKRLLVDEQFNDFYSMSPCNADKDNEYLIKTSGFKLDLAYEEQFSDYRTRIVLKHIGNGKYVTNPIYKTLFMHSNAFSKIIEFWPSIIKPRVKLHAKIISWCFTRDGTRMLTITQDIDKYSRDSATIAWHLNLYKFDKEDEPLTYPYMIDIIQIQDEQVIQKILRESLINIKDLERYSNIEKNDIQMTLLDDESTLIITDAISGSTHFIKNQNAESQNNIQTLIQQIPIQYLYLQHQIRTHYTRIISQGKNQVYLLDESNKYHSATLSDQDPYLANLSDCPEIKDIYQFNPFDLIIYNDNRVGIYDVLSNSITELKEDVPQSLFRNYGICAFNQSESSLNDFQLAVFDYENDKIEIIKITRNSNAQYSISLKNTFAFDSQNFSQYNLERLINYSEPYFILSSKYSYYIKQCCIVDNQITCREQISFSSNNLYCQYSEYFPYIQNSQNEFFNFKNSHQLFQNNEILPTLPYSYLASKKIIEQLYQKTQQYFQESSFQFVPENYLFIYESRYFISLKKRKVLKLEINGEFQQKLTKYANNSLIIFFTSSSNDLITVFINDDFEIQYHTNKLETSEASDQFTVSEDGSTLYQIVKDKIRVYSLSKEQGLQYLEEYGQEILTKQKFQLRFKENVSVQNQLYSLIDKNSLPIIGDNNDGFRMLSFQNSHQILYKKYGEQAWFLDNKHLKIQSIVRFQYLISGIEIINGNIYYTFIEDREYYDKQLKIGQDVPGFIPSQLFFKEGIITIWDEENPNQLQYYESITKIDKQQMLASLTLRLKLDPVLDCCQNDEVENFEKIMEQIQVKDLNYLMQYSTIIRSNVFSLTRHYKYFSKICQAFKKKFEQQEYSEFQSLIMHDLCQNGARYYSIFEILLQRHELELAQLILNYIIKQDSTGILYQEINWYFSEMNEKKLDLKGYFESQYGLMMISDEYFYNLKNNDQEVLFPVQQELVSDVQHDFYDIEQEIRLKNLDQNFTIEYGLINIGGRLLELDENQKQVDQRKLIQIIQQIAERDPNILEIEAIKLIIQFKWQNYTRLFFGVQLILLLIFIASFIVDVVAISRDKEDFNIENKTQIVTRIICVSSIVIFAAYELTDFLKNRRDYLKEFWNLNDILIILLYIVFFILSFADASQDYALKSLQCLIVISAFIKLCYLIRIFTKLSFLVQMLIKVFIDLRYFLLFFAMVVGAMTVMIQILLRSSTSKYDGIQTVAFYVLALRQSVGDTDTDTLIGEGDEDKPQKDYKVLFWLLWFVIIIVGNVVFMNFIIAVVSESYENCMERMIQSIQQAQLDMIEECEGLLPQRIFENKNLFPPFILVRRPVKEDDGGNGDGSEWQGFVKQMKRHFERETAIMKAEFEKQRRPMSEMKKKLELVEKEAKEANERMMRKLEQNQEENRKMEEKIDSLIKMVEGIVSKKA